MVPHLTGPAFRDQGFDTETIWVTKHDKYETHASPEQLAHAESHYYFFRTDGQMSVTALDDLNEAGRILAWVKKPTNDYLYLWSSIAQSAVNLAANMGAKNIFLIGCDNSSLADNHHAHNQHTLWKGVDPNFRYMQYYEGLAEMRPVLAERGINLVSINPFLKLDDPAMDFRRLCQEQDKPHLIANEDIYRPTSLRDNNLRYLRLTKAMARQNFRHLSKSFRRKTKLITESLFKQRAKNDGGKNRRTGA
jgi:hypothetical protein